MPYDIFTDPNFSNDDFASSVFTSNVPMDDYTPEQDGEDNEGIHWPEYPDGPNNLSRVIEHDGRSSQISESANHGYTDRPVPIRPATQRVTDERRESERIDRARNDSGKVARRSATNDSGGDGKGRFSDKVKRSIEYAREQLERDGDTDDSQETNGVSPNPRVKRKYDVVRVSRPPEFTGCTFKCTFQKLMTVANGEWILQVRSTYGDNEEIQKLAKSHGIVLLAHIERAKIDD